MIREKESTDKAVLLLRMVDSVKSLEAQKDFNGAIRECHNASRIASELATSFAMEASTILSDYQDHLKAKLNVSRSESQG